MGKLNGYIANTIIAAILVVLLVIVGLDTMTAIIDELDNLRGEYQFSNALMYILMTIPGRLYEFLPYATLIGCLAGLGTLATNSELVIIRAVGVSLWRLIWMVMRPALLIMLVGMLISEYIAPRVEQIAQSERAIALHGESGMTNREGLWHREGNRIMHFNVVQPNGVLYGVSTYEFDAHKRLVSTAYAERASFQNGKWLMEESSKSMLSEDRVTAETVALSPWETNLSPQLLNVLILEPDNLSISGLKHYIAYLSAQGLDSGEYQLAFWSKCLRPLATVGLVLVAISFILGPLREVTIGFRIFTGVLVGIAFRTSQDLLAPASLVYDFSPMWASLVPILICCVAGLIMLRRTF